MAITPFKVEVAEHILQDLRERLDRTRWPEELGVHPRTVNNYFRPAWLAQRNLGHLRFGSQEPQLPRSILENRAWEKCEAGEHAWMAEELYRGHAYTESESTEELEGFGGSTIKTVYSDTTCHFCGRVIRRRKHGFLVT